MRCLYCGKELALLKRWTGGGEFCSDAHRQQYQDEYNQLALNRLLQAKPPAETPKEAAPKPAVSAPSPAVSEPARQEAEREPDYGGVTVAALPPEPVTISESPQPYPEVQAEKIEEPVQEQPEIAAPAELAGFFTELPVPPPVNAPSISHPELELLAARLGPALPVHQFHAANATEHERHLEFGGLVEFPLSNGAVNCTTNRSRDRLEVREFPRTAPIAEVELHLPGEMRLGASNAAIDFSLLPEAPPAAAALWQAPAVDFAPGATELGDMCRLAFATTGFSEVAATYAAVDLEPEPDETETPAAPEPPAKPAVEVHVEPEALTRPFAPKDFVNPFAPRITPAVVLVQPKLELAAPVVETPVVESAVQQPAEQTVAEQEAAEQPAVAQSSTGQGAAEEAAVVEPIEEPVLEQPDVEQTAAAEPVAVPPPAPRVATTRIIIALQAAAPGKGKPAQVFSTATYNIQAELPRSTSLPLRPVMTLGPTPVKESSKEAPTVPPAAEPKKTGAPVAPARRPVSEPQSKQAAKAEAKDAKKSVSEPDNKPDPKIAKPKDEVKLPAPLAAPYSSPASDLGLPKLSLQPQTGLWGRLPFAAKIAIVVVMLAAVGGAIVLSSKSGSATTSAVSHTPTVVEGNALPAGDAGWITDWGADPGVRRTRQISILRSSQTYTDYRIEMEGQIETKAIGWVFRAADPKNFYVTKLEIVKPGLEPTVALVRFAVINGEEQVRAQIPLPLKVRRDTMYKIRFDAVGNHFTTYVQDEKIDEWTDDRVKTGGVGMYSERGEAATLKGGVNVVPLLVRK